MLEIRNISKIYKTGSLTQQALDGVSLTLRENEFVAILGQSGSGKTTLLNIIGGLDRYDDGDLIISGVSTRQYSDRDWDSYRNHTVGFVFQSYNLIPHQTILSNVELALTISGISRRERTRRAVEALEKVGLKEHIHKRPSQLSGGQMQRVAIARALVNDPEILLADEPTGALDSDTSIQVMDLLQEVARDRLVVMVTHNPELAEQYATRIVRLKDGHIISDSDPVTNAGPAEGVHRNMGKASMSFLTALSLSFNNLRTKKARTILVAIAGSIGIIGIAMILSLSNGVDKYIQNVEEETLQDYPLQITNTSFNLLSMYANAQDQEENLEEQPQTQEEQLQEDPVREIKTVTSMFSRVSSNDLKSLKAFLDSGDSGMEAVTRAVEYNYAVTPQLFSITEDGNGKQKVRQVNPDNSFSAMGFSAMDSSNSLMSSFSSTDTFHAMPANTDLYIGQYDVKAGRWPERYNECVLVLTSSGSVTDLTLYTLGLKDPLELEDMIRIFMEGGEPAEETEPLTFDYDAFPGISFSLLPSSSLYVYDPEYQVYSDKTGDADYLLQAAQTGETVTLVGVVQPKEDASSPILSPGLGYPASLTQHLMDLAAGSELVQAQLADPDTDILTGTPFGEQPQTDMDMSGLFTVDEKAMEDAFGFDAESLDPESFDLESLDLSDFDLSQMDFSDFDLDSMDLSQVDTSAFSSMMPSISAADMADLFSGIRVNFNLEAMESLFSGLLEGYQDYARSDPATDYEKLPEALETYFASEEAQAILSEGVRAMLEEKAQYVITAETLRTAVEAVMAGYPAYLEAAGLKEAENPYAYVSNYLSTPDAQAALTAQAETMREMLANLPITAEDLAPITQGVMEGYQSYAQANGLPELSRLQSSFEEYLNTPEAQTAITAGVGSVIDTSGLEQKAAVLLSSYSYAMSSAIGTMMEQVIGTVVTNLTQTMTEAFTDLATEALTQMGERMSENLSTAFDVDMDAFSEAITMNFSGTELRDLMTSLLSTEQASYSGNLRKLGYADPSEPSTITIYPTDFEGKAQVKQILDDYNKRMEASGQDEQVISYTDVVDALMRSVTDIIDAISYVLIAFVAISLVVSSIMIGVITYISVLERNKEIGILRAIGASKRNISQVFNAETFIIGALAGLFGIGITLILLIPTNIIIRSLTDQTNIRAILPPGGAVALVILSIVLTLIGGIIPSRKAARSDPVAALRSE